jgi:hypothetical protein
MSFRGTLIGLVRSAADTIGHSRTRPPEQQSEPAIPIYIPRKIVDPAKHIQELGAIKQPYANVHIDAID